MSYMSTVSYTLRIPEELKVALEAEAKRTKQSLAQVVILKLTSDNDKKVFVRECQENVASEYDKVGTCLVGSSKIEKMEVPAYDRPSHDSATCRLYGCGMCAVEKAK